MIDVTEASKWKRLPLRLAYPFAEAHALASEVAAINPDLPNNLRRGLIVQLLKNKKLLEEFIDTCWHNGRELEGQQLIQGYLRMVKRYEDVVHDDEEEAEEEAELDSETGTEALGFVRESELRDHLVRDLQVLERGLTLFQDERGSGVEYHFDGGQIDILAKDSAGRFVVIELKGKKGRYKTVGQILYYMGWVDTNLASAPCRGIIVAKTIVDDLKMACQRIPDIALYQYAVSVTVDQVATV